MHNCKEEGKGYIWDFILLQIKMGKVWEQFLFTAFTLIPLNKIPCNQMIQKSLNILKSMPALEIYDQ